MKPGLRVLFVDFQTYNPSTNLNFFARLAFETSAAGARAPPAAHAAARWRAA
jgi:hypothetical protein